MKVIAVDNFDRDGVSDILVCENVNEFYGKFIVERLNERFSGDDSNVFYKLVDGNYKLYEWHP